MCMYVLKCILGTWNILHLAKTKGAHKDAYISRTSLQGSLLCVTVQGKTKFYKTKFSKSYITKTLNIQKLSKFDLQVSSYIRRSDDFMG